MDILDFIVNDPTGVKLIQSLVLIFVIILVTRLIKRIVFNKLEDSKKYYTFKQRLNYGTGFIIMVGILFIWISSAASLTTYIGLLSAGIAIALKEIFVNMAGWMFIEFRRPFDVGHRISIGPTKGDVIDKRMFQFTLMEVSNPEDGEQSTGRIIDVPNSFVFIHPTINYTKGFEYIWNEIKVLITFESDWQLMKKLLLDIGNKDTDFTTEKVAEQIKNASKRYMINYNKLTPIVYTDVLDSGVLLSLRYLCEPKHKRITSDKIWEDVLRITESYDNIDLAYPTKRVLQEVKRVN